MLARVRWWLIQRLLTNAERENVRTIVGLEPLPTWLLDPAEDVYDTTLDAPDESPAPAEPVQIDATVDETALLVQQLDAQLEAVRAAREAREVWVLQAAALLGDTDTVSAYELLGDVQQAAALRLGPLILARYRLTPESLGRETCERLQDELLPHDALALAQIEDDSGAVTPAPWWTRAPAPVMLVASAAGWYLLVAVLGGIAQHLGLIPTCA